MHHTPSFTASALFGLALLQLLMLLALMSGLEPHPPAYAAPFAMGPFLSASIVLCVVAALQVPRQGMSSPLMGMLAATLALLSYGPHKWLDPQIAHIWPAVLLGQLAAIGVWIGSLARFRQAFSARALPDRGDR